MSTNIHTTEEKALRLLFVINPSSGNKNINWSGEIDLFFDTTVHTVEKYVLEKKILKENILEKIKAFRPDRVIVAGGDGTVKLVAACVQNTDIILGILPAGSANGMARELGVPSAPQEAIAATLHNHSKKIHLVQINDELCIHLSDIGFNAYLVKTFESGNERGMWGYAKACWKTLWQYSYMTVAIHIDKKKVIRKAKMVVIANATKYGSGALINPAGKLDDDVFEIIVIKKISLLEIFKMLVTHQPYNTEKTELFQTSALTIRSRKKVHFQVDGEYLGKVDTVEACLLPQQLSILVPQPPTA